MIISKKIVNDYSGMINDHRRNAWFRKHIYTTVNNKVFADIGSGTGILSAYAVEAGAAHGYAIEINKEAVACSKYILDQLGYKNKITFVNDQFQSANLSGVEVVVADQVGPALFDQLQLDIWRQAKRFCVPDYISIPDEIGVDLYVFAGDVTNSNNILLDNNSLPKGFYSAIAGISICPVKVFENIISVTPDTVDRPLEFIVDLAEFGTATLVFVNKIAYQKDYLYLNQSTTQTWKHSPRLYIPDCTKPIRVQWDSSIPNKENPIDSCYCGYWSAEQI